MVLWVYGNNLRKALEQMVNYPNADDIRREANRVMWERKIARAEAFKADCRANGQPCANHDSYGIECPNRAEHKYYAGFWLCGDCKAAKAAKKAAREAKAAAKRAKVAY